jgi:hypothetical protein
MKIFMKESNYMNSIICTLYEGHYHFGVAGLVNSLSNHSYKGDIYGGFRGDIPFWAEAAKENKTLNWKDTKTLQVTDGLYVHFMPLTTDWHLTNYKPQFMIKLMEDYGMDAKGIAYFDPDIVIKYKWDFFETWLSYGVAMVHEIACIDMPPTHPIRRGWETIISKTGRKTTRRLHSYMNAGFCGVSKIHIEFLHVWQDLIQMAIKEYAFNPCKFTQDDSTKLFGTGDQDAFNMAAMCSESPISEFGPEGMDFVHSGWLMSHATGSSKPWTKNFIKWSLNGRAPSIPDRTYWQNMNGPIVCFSSRTIKMKHIKMTIAAFIGRFYSRK